MLKRLNIIDYCVIIFIILLIGFVGVRVFVFGDLGAGMGGRGNTGCELVFVSDGVLAEFAENIQTSGEIYTDKEELIGNVKMVKLSDSHILVKKADGTYKQVVNPERRTVSVTVDSEGRQAEDGFRIYGNREVAVGRTYYVKSNDTVYEMRLSEININQ